MKRHINGIYFMFCVVIEKQHEGEWLSYVAGVFGIGYFILWTLDQLKFTKRKK